MFNKLLKLSLLASLFLSVLSCTTVDNSKTHDAPTDLKVEDRINSIGVGDTIPAFSWITEDYKEGKGKNQSSFQIIVASSPETLDDKLADMWNSGKIVSDNSAYISYGGKSLESEVAYYWKVRTWNSKGKVSEWSAPAQFETGLLSNRDWQDAKWIWRDTKDKGSDYSYYRKTVEIPDKQVIRARIYITASNRYELYINGKPAGKGPNFAYPDEYYYQTLDIGSFLLPGQQNIIGLLAVHWNKGGQGRPKGESGLLFKAVIDFSDGTSLVTTSDKTCKTLQAKEWKITKIYRNGEGIPYDNIDGRLHPVGWNEQYYDDSKWEYAVEKGSHPVSPWINPLIAQETEITEYEISPVQIKTIGDGHFVADFGKIYPGMPKLSFSEGKPGTLIKIKADYRTKEDGTLTGFSQNTKMDYEYILRGGNEIFRAFSYLAFRYLEVENVPLTFNGQSIRMIVRHHKADNEQSAFECSDDMINRIWELAKRSAILSCHELFVDTPTREQGQFTADAFLVSAAVMRTFLERNLSRKGILEFAQSQLRYHANTGKVNSAYPNNDGKRDITDWTQQFICWAWDYYMQTGDLRLISKIFDQLVHTGNYNKNSENRQSGLIDWGSVPAVHKRGLRYPTGIIDWVDHYDYDVTTSQRTVLSINAYLNYLYLSKLAKALDREDEHSLFNKYAQDILSSIRGQLWDEEQKAYIDGLYEDGSKSKHASQQANSMMLALSLTEEGQEESVMNTVKAEGHNTGILLIKYLIQAYGEYGEEDALYEYLTNPDGKNWAYILAHDGTFTWENWRLHEPVFSESHGYAAYAAISALQEYILGVKPLLPQYAHVQIKPGLTGKLQFANGKIPTQRGAIFIDWKNNQEDKTFRMTVKIPFNITADVYVPLNGVSGKTVIVNGKKKKGKLVGKYILFKDVEAGEYAFIR